MNDKKESSARKKDKPETFNAHIPPYLLAEVNKQLEVFPQLKPSDLIRNILHLYYFDEKAADWLPQNKDEIHQESKPKRRSFK